MNGFKKNVIKIAFLYGSVLVLINFIGAGIPLALPAQTEQAGLMANWISILNEHSTLINLITIFTFIVPAVLCASYVFLAREKSLQKTFINLPLVYSALGIAGWIVYFVSEAIFCLYAVKKTEISVSAILGTSFVFVVQEALFSFTLSFLIIDYLHRKFFLPKYFPDGNLSRYKGTIRPSLKLLFFVIYISIAFFPIFYLSTQFFYTLRNNGIEIDKNVVAVLSTIMAIGILILVIFSRYFSEPLKKLKLGTEKVKEGNYKDKVNIVSNDSFGELSDTFNEMITSLDEKTKKIISIQESIIKGMALVIESRDNSTGGHINRTSDCVKVFSQKLKQTEEYGKLPDSFFESVIKAAPMHDLGKVAVDDSILRKPGKFTDDEYEKMKSHSAEGAKIVEYVLAEVENLEFKQIAINVAHYHHEKWNGLGYPERISGESIPLEARIMAFCDVFDALVSRRCYKESFSFDKAFEIIENDMGTHFDPALGKHFIACRKELEELYRNYAE